MNSISHNPKWGEYTWYFLELHNQLPFPGWLALRKYASLTVHN